MNTMERDIKRQSVATILALLFVAWLGMCVSAWALSASGGGAFTGGTITQDLTISTADQTGLQLTNTAVGKTFQLGVGNTFDDLWLTSQGNGNVFDFSSGDHALEFFWDLDVHTTTPTLSAGCNGSGASISGSDNAGTITTQTASATTCTITFANTFLNAPTCVFTDGRASTSPLAFSAGATTATTAIVDFASGASLKINYVCIGG